MINKFLDYIEAYLHRREYERNFKLNRVTSAITYLLRDSMNPNAERTKHPLHSKRLEEYKDKVGYWLDGKDVNINFGDSLTDMARKQLDVCHDAIFSISGSWSHHIKMMAEDMKESLNRVNIKNISIGCLGGNPLLAYQNYNEVVSDALNCLNRVRELYPDSRIIVYGLPPVYNIHVSENTYQFDLELFNWVTKDSNARFINLKNKFGKGFGKLFPQIEYGVDGLHFNPNGASKFAELIKKEQQ